MSNYQIGIDIQELKQRLSRLESLLALPRGDAALPNLSTLPPTKLDEEAIRSFEKRGFTRFRILAFAHGIKISFFKSGTSNALLLVPAEFQATVDDCPHFVHLDNGTIYPSTEFRAIRMRMSFGGADLINYMLDFFVQDVANGDALFIEPSAEYTFTRFTLQIYRGNSLQAVINDTITTTNSRYELSI